MRLIARRVGARQPRINAAAESGLASGDLPPPLRHGARPRASVRVRMARRQRLALSLPEALLLRSVALAAGRPLREILRRRCRRRTSKPCKPHLTRWLAVDWTRLPNTGRTTSITGLSRVRSTTVARYMA